jgi:DNA-binding response OmpR family regulator
VQVYDTIRKTEGEKDMPETKIMVVEDEQAILELICMNLEATGYRTIQVSDGIQAQNLLGGSKEENFRAEDIALALVDVMLPGKDGFALMEDFQRAQIPVIYLTAKADVDSKVFGLRSGAEDYIVKPFEILELLARIEKVLDRTGRGQSRLYIKDVVIDRERHCVYKKGKPVSLKPMEYELLVVLAQKRNVAMSREELIRLIWGTDYLGETRTIDVHIGQLRKKLAFQEVIRTIPKMGYRLEDQGR